MRKKMIILDGSTEILLPVTPASFEMHYSLKIETVNIHTVGDVNLAGYRMPDSISVESFFPAQNYPFAYAPTISVSTPYDYVAYFQRFVDQRTVVRWIVSDTSINLPVLIEDISYGENDGSGDVYYTLSMQEYRYLKAVQINRVSRPSSDDRTGGAVKNYVIKRGDTLWALARKNYGDPKLCYALAKYNNIKNPNLIITGRTLKIPPKSQLGV